MRNKLNSFRCSQTRTLLLAAFVSVISHQAVAAPSLKLEGLQTLPVAQLAPRLLGEVGKSMIGVDRSNFPYDIKFFGRAHAPPTQYGLCESDWITLYLENDGAIRSISAGPKFGVVDAIYQYPDRLHEEENERLCAGLADTQGFFPAPDWIAAQHVVAYLDYLKGAGPFSGKDYDFECTGGCAGIDGRAYLRKIETKDITSVSVIDCDDLRKAGDCYKIELTGTPPGLFPRELRIYGAGSRESAVVSKALLWIGATMY